MTRNRIKDHRKVRAGDLIPHELNFRTHPENQKKALKALYQEVGFARSLLAYELADGRLKLIDGHLRRSMDPDEIVDVEVLDVSDDEARKLLLSVDPLAALAQTDDAALQELKSLTESDNDALNDLWASIETASDKATKEAKANEQYKPQFIVLIECTNEKQQLTLLKKLKTEGIECRALIS